MPLDGGRPRVDWLARLRYLRGVTAETAETRPMMGFSAVLTVGGGGEHAHAGPTAQSSCVLHRDRVVATGDRIACAECRAKPDAVDGPGRARSQPAAGPVSVDAVIDLVRHRDAALIVEPGALSPIAGQRLHPTTRSEPASRSIATRRSSCFTRHPATTLADGPPPRPWRCVIAECTTPIPDDETAFCPMHRAQADTGWPVRPAAPGAAASDQTLPEPSAPAPSLLSTSASTASLPLAPRSHVCWWARPGYRPALVATPGDTLPRQARTE
jgi:hypothetical protein